MVTLQRSRWKRSDINERQCYDIQPKDTEIAAKVELATQVEAVSSSSTPVEDSYSVSEPATDNQDNSPTRDDSIVDMSDRHSVVDVDVIYEVEEPVTEGRRTEVSHQMSSYFSL